MQSSEQFDTLYARLNAEQRQAVDTIDGPVMVVAGPGTGKTQILTLRIANILRQTDTPADAILALTFTNAAATNMRARLVSIIGSDAYRVGIFTFHSFAEHLIQRYPDYFPSIIGRSSCSDVERLDIVRTLIEAGRYEKLKPLNAPFHHVQAIISAIGSLKREGFTPERFSEWIATERDAIEKDEDAYHAKGAHAGKMKKDYAERIKKLEKDAELAQMYEQYEAMLATRKRYDFDDMLLLLIAAFEQHEDFLRFVQEQFHYFLVDEHQDSNGAQNRILELLATFFDNPNLFVVGDEKQAIFRFQGASMANFLYFAEKFRNVTRITLATNYRSHQGILDNADTLISHSAHTIAAPLVAHGEKDVRPIDVCAFASDDEELLFAAEQIQQHLKNGVPAHELAVLYRHNGDALQIADYFERLGIPFVVASGHGVLDDPDVRKLNAMLRALENLDDSDTLVPLVFLDIFSVPIEECYALLRAAQKEQKTLFAALGEAVEGVAKDTPLAQLYAFVRNAKRVAENDSFLALFEYVVRESGLLTHLQQSSFHTEKFDKIVRLFDEVKALVRREPFFALPDYTRFLSVMHEHRQEITAAPRHVPEAVRLMTAHKAKGLEFAYVYILHAYNGKWGGGKNSAAFLLPVQSGGEAIATKEDNVEDERRLFYVALTRARMHATIAYATNGPDGKERIPSQFIEELQNTLVAQHTAEELGYAGKRPPFFVAREGISGRDRYAGVLRETFNERGISPTALNNFLTCPWRWFYNNFFYTQFVPSVAQRAGTAAHGALEDFFNTRNGDGVGGAVGREYVLDRFAYHLDDADLRPDERERVHKEMADALMGWYDTYEGSFPRYSKNEFAVRGVLLDDIRLTGKIDRVECLDGGLSPDTCHDVRVTDYKTGKVKSDNEAAGLRESDKRVPGAGGYKRQIVCYKLLLDRYAEGKYHMQEGVIDYLKPNDSGKYKKNVFTVTEADEREVVQQIRETAAAIRGCTFWDERCSDAKCTWCALRELMGN
jgi:DNA helicase II / ATP-dependent DNA helicase PcrA